MAMLFTHLVVGIVLGVIALDLGLPFSFFAVFVLSSIFPDLDIIVGEHRKTLHNVILYVFLFFITGVVYLNNTFNLILLMFAGTIGLTLHCLIDYHASSTLIEGSKKNRISIYSHYHGGYLKGSSYIETATSGDLLLLSSLGIVVVILENSFWITSITIVSIILAYSYSLYTKLDDISLDKSQIINKD